METSGRKSGAVGRPCHSWEFSPAPCSPCPPWLILLTLSSPSLLHFPTDCLCGGLSRHACPLPSPLRKQGSSPRAVAKQRTPQAPVRLGRLGPTNEKRSSRHLLQAPWIPVCAEWRWEAQFRYGLAGRPCALGGASLGFFALLRSRLKRSGDKGTK